MSYHRVLPPLYSLTNVAASQLTEQHALVRHRIMTAEESRDTTDKKEDKTVLKEGSLSPPSVSRKSISTDQNILSDSELLSLNSLAVHPSRKRKTSHASNGVNHDSERSLPPISTISTANLDSHITKESPSDICLCQKDPKVPRPRNAFILYRQHLQSVVVASHPGLANPEVSKIIGDRWRNSSQEVKDHWKLLADEEKLRHQRRYPDYRYQPRRSERNNSVTTPLSSITPSNTRCLKCGGRSITVPSMSTPDMPTPTTPGTTYTPNIPPTPSSSASGGRFLHMMNAPHRGPAVFRPRPGSTNIPIGALTIASPRDRRPGSPVTPDAKRRRFSNGSHHVRGENGQSTAFQFAERRESLPRPDFMPSISGRLVGPPPLPRHRESSSVHQDASLTLPPLQPTAALTSPQLKSVEAMVMSIPHINKIKVLAKISPPLSNQTPKSSVRGAIIAIDGADIQVVKNVITYLSDFLSKGAELSTRVFEGPSSKSPSDIKDTEGVVNYLRRITEWHSVSSEVIQYITEIPQPATPPPVSPKTVPEHSNKSGTATTAISGTSSPLSSSSTANSHPIPVALIAQYQLSHTDASASKIPIKDAYAPVDHWQWMATLWRGIVGPDITVVIKDAAASAPGNDGKDAASTGTGVEVRLADARALLVKSGETGVPESGLRRVGFEIGEWVRGMAERAERGRG